MSRPTVGELSPEQQDKALQGIAELQKVRQTSVDKFVKHVKARSLFQPSFNWGDILSAAPVAISLMGNLFVAATIPDATRITIIPQEGGFKFLPNFGSNTALNACLVHCADMGSKAFVTARSSFDTISLYSEDITINKVKTIVAILGDASRAQKELVPALRDLSDDAHNCEQSAEEMEAAFQHWLDVVCELHVCVIQTSHDASEKLAANQAHMAAAKAKLTGSEKAEATAKKTVDDLSKTLDTATKAYKQAVDQFPSGWELVGQQLVSELGHSLTSAIDKVVPALIEKFSTTAKINDAVNIFKGDHGGAKGGSVGDGKADHSNVPAANSAPSPVPNALPPYPQDPAYSIIGHVSTYITTILAFVTGGKDKGVDWDLLQSQDPKKQSNGLSVMVDMMATAETDFKPSSDPPSVDLQKVFQDVKTVTTALSKAITDSKAINAPPLPDSKSTTVQEWQRTMRASAAKAHELDTDSKHLSTPVAPTIKSPEATSSPTDQRGAFRQQIIDAATTKLDKTSHVLETVTANYKESSEKLVDVQLKLAELHAEIAGLDVTKIDLTEIKKVLVKAMDILSQLKTQITKLRSFFTAIKTLVAFVEAKMVKDFISEIERDTGVDEKNSIANISFADYQQQAIFSASLNLKAYFELFYEIANMYTGVHDKFIMKGLDMVNTLQAEYNAGSPEEVQKIVDKRNKEINDYTQSTLGEVNKSVKKKQDDLLKHLRSTAEEEARLLEFVPVSPEPAVAAAITKSSNVSKEAAKKGISQSGKYLTRKLADTSSVLDEF
ncbi:hypothetical protein BDV41DRAFT_573904 [Aspergillus transmontanensis]|uniref:Uncharacterized protein n=1 Tax=Aspergillus transmontanensis TaxID=1034304 RepID=A0A5N6W700_9EURO|nr:hypothetical protein BDV41DRAFT_573904 [Aspergillus transmontanensis]